MNETTRTYDVVVIGAGPVGENVAERARAAGLSTVIVERELIGGECSFWACDPSKALLRPVVARADARRVPGLGQAVAGPLDVEAVLAHRDKMSSYWKDEDQVDWLNSVSVDLIRGHGRLTGPKQVAVQTPDGETIALTARHAVAVSTGTRAALPPIPGIDTVRPWTSREATSADKVPGRLAVVGGGVVAVEMATAYAALGSKVTVIARSGLLGGHHGPIAVVSGSRTYDASRCGAWVRTAASTCLLEGLTMEWPATDTVGTVSFPSATERTNAAASGSRQMFTSV